MQAVTDTAAVMHALPQADVITFCLSGVKPEQLTA